MFSVIFIIILISIAFLLFRRAHHILKEKSNSKQSLYVFCYLALSAAFILCAWKIINNFKIINDSIYFFITQKNR